MLSVVRRVFGERPRRGYHISLPKSSTVCPAKSRRPPLTVPAASCYDWAVPNTKARLAMHIPDGYLSPQTYVPAFAAVVPIWAIASRKLKATLRTRQAPLLALAAAFCFVLMMFNVPIPGGTTGHAVGAVLTAVLLGPWAATVAVSLAIIVQAVLFQDGGITAIGANCLDMAVVLPWVGWAVYRLIAGASPLESRRRLVGGALGGYIGLNAAALTAAVMFGIQPLIARGLDGRPLYCPFGLSVAVPAMMLGHLMVFGWVEALATGLVIAYLQRMEPSLLRPAPGWILRGTGCCSGDLWSCLGSSSLGLHWGYICPLGTRPGRRGVSGACGRSAGWRAMFRRVFGRARYGMRHARLCPACKRPTDPGNRKFPLRAFGLVGRSRHSRCWACAPKKPSTLDERITYWNGKVSTLFPRLRWGKVATLRWQLTKAGGRVFRFSVVKG